MRTITVPRDNDTWRAHARAMLNDQVPPEEILWQEQADTQLLLLATKPEPQPASPKARTIRVPRDYSELAHDVFHHRSPDRFALLYRLLWRIVHGERNLLKIEVDEDVHAALAMQRQVRWDAHRMNGFVRFEKMTDPEGELFLAWYRPDHYVVPLVAGDFARRFGDMRWSILTPDDSAHWDQRQLRLGPGVATRPATNDQLTSLWQTYYKSTYNPQRDNPRLFRQHVPTRFLRDLPEGRAPVRS